MYTEALLGFTATLSNPGVDVVWCDLGGCLYGWFSDFSGPASLDLNIRDNNDSHIISSTSFYGTVDGSLYGYCGVFDGFASCEEWENFNLSAQSSNGFKATGPGQMGGDLAGTAGGFIDLNVETPEPGTLLIFGSGMIGLAGMLRRKLML